MLRTALVTLPALMQEVHTWSRLGDPSTMARMRWMFGFQRRFVRTWLWLMLLPNDGCLPHTSHTAAMGTRTFGNGVDQEPSDGSSRFERATKPEG